MSNNEFNFPFTPYEIQENFMRALFQTLDHRQFGIFESPTGTGKSLSMICGALTWLNKHENQRIEDLKSEIRLVEQVENEPTDDNDDWISAAAEKIQQNQKKVELKQELEFLLKKVEKIKDLKRKRQSLNINQIKNKLDIEFDELFPKNAGDKENDENLKRELSALQNGLSLEDNEHFLEDYISDDEDEELHDADDPFREEKKDYSLRIFYCSRTHSQLSQFVKEIHKTKFAQDIRLISLASRSNMCINESVLSLKNSTLINERCLEMQKNKSKPKKTESSPPNKKRKKGYQNGGSCEFFKSSAISNLRDHSLLEVQDIEQLVQKGRQMNACPYYASRKAIEDAQIVIIPYNTLLHSSTREAINIQLENSVVIIDEAHNVLETIAHIHSAEITKSHLVQAQDQLKAYFKKYGGLLKAKNLLYIKHLLFLLSKLLKIFMMQSIDKTDKATMSARLMQFSDFLAETDILDLNIFKLIRYVEKSKISHKLRGFYKTKMEKDSAGVTEENNTENKKGLTNFLKRVVATTSKPSPMSLPKGAPQSTEAKAISEENKTTSTPLLPILAFMQTLINGKSELRVLIDPKKESIKALLLNPASQFTELVTKCRSIIVAGGTMQPISEFRDRLFVQAGAPIERISNFSCDHIVPQENVLPLVIKCGPTSKLLDFSFQRRDQPETLSELSRVLMNACNVIPGGVVVFFPSYEYESRAFEYLKKGGDISKLEQKKKVFREPKKSNEMDKVLRDYSRAAKDCGGILFSVVGGKMSEGINFSDDLGRSVIMIGLPFPNAHSPELKEKMAYLNQKVAPDAGKIHYENLCMKAVNQSIGRAIRHKNDYACILLLDHRYERMQTHLPGWIKRRVEIMERYGPVNSKLTKFFKSMKNE